jgi:hypothetical protein
MTRECVSYSYYKEWLKTLILLGMVENLSILDRILASGSKTVVEDLTHDPKLGGSNTLAAGTGKEKFSKKSQYFNDRFEMYLD